MLGDVVTVLEKWLSTATPLASVMLAFAPGPDGNPAIIALLAYHGGEEEGKKAFKPIFDLGEDTGMGIPELLTTPDRPGRQYDQHDSL
jgi:hypothetical protein